MSVVRTNCNDLLLFLIDGHAMLHNKRGSTRRMCVVWIFLMPNASRVRLRIIFGQH